MSIKNTVIAYLQEQPLFRERKNKDRGIVNLLMKRYGALRDAVESGAISKDAIIALVHDYGSMDRMWRKALERDPELRGKDYDEKEYLEEEAMERLGYRVPPRRP